MRHTISLTPSASIKSQRIHCRPLPNFHQDQVVRIQQDGNSIYAIYTPDQPPSSHISSLCLTYMKLNHIEQETLATMCKVVVSGRTKYVEIELSEMDYNLVNSNFGVLQRGFLDQVNVIWPHARIPLYYNESNYIVLMPNCKQVQLVDPYAAISFIVKAEDDGNNSALNNQQQQLEFQDRVMVLGRVDGGLRSDRGCLFGYDNVIYLNKREFCKLKRYKFGSKRQQSSNTLSQFYCTIQPMLPFLTSPTYQEFQQYKRLQAQKKLPQLKPILVQLSEYKQQQSQSQSIMEGHIRGGRHRQQYKQTQEKELMGDSCMNQVIYFTCSQISKLSLRIPQQLALTQENIHYNNNNQSFQTTTLAMFLKQLAQKTKYQINLQIPELYHLAQNEIQSIKMQFAKSFLDVVREKKEFVFLQNYYPFMVSGYVCGVLVARMSANKKGFQPLKSFFMVKDISANKQEWNMQNTDEIIKNIIQSLNITYDLPAQKVSQWLPIIKHLQSAHTQQQDKQPQSINNNTNTNNNPTQYNNPDTNNIFNQIFQRCYNNQLFECCQFLASQTTSPSPPKLLITTYSSNGKTYLYDYLSSIRNCVNRQVNYRSWYIDCRIIIGISNRIDDVRDYLDAVVTFCPYKMLFFDNIDAIMPLIEEGDQMRQKEKIVARVLGEYLFYLLTSNNKLAVFTAKSQANIDQNFKFDKVIKLKNPNRQLRADIVHSLKFNKPNSWIEEFIDKTESFSLGSLAHYIMSQEIPVKKQSKRKNDFSKIVGLAQAKRVIRSVIEKPNKFGFIYDKVKIKVPRGILLYGATGNGKTALGSSVQDEFPMKYFSVKGSDILSKYIGGSEAAVRDIFEKALSVAPSIIFFDEFQSIVPRRNSSGTGVTDRVVNQFLCYLDGVSSTTGVFIIAASSRPDLIDPALLRPGRIDSHIYLQYPTQQQRSQLLSLFNNSIKLQITEQQFIHSTNNYSYSDLIGLLKQLRIKRSSQVLKQKQHPLVEEFKYISKGLFYETVKSYRMGTDVEEQINQNELYIRFKQGKGPQIKKQRFVQM